MPSILPPGVRRDARRLLALSTPVVATQLGVMMLGVVDTVMVGRVSIAALDAASLGHLWLFGTMILGMGVIFGLDPIVSQAHGAGDHERVALALQRGVVVALMTSVPIGVLWLCTGAALTLAGQDPSLSLAAHRYVAIQLPSLPLFLAYNALRQYLQGRGIVAPALWITLLANLFNVFGNWVLIFGNLGLPALGLEGAGIASALTRCFLLIGLVVWVRRFGLHERAWTPWSRRALKWSGIREVLASGIPVSIQYGLEVWAFQIATLMAGRLGTKELAAHTIVMNMASLAFMMPLGISIGAATLVGNLIGARDHAGAQRSAWVAVVMGAAVMTASAITFIALRHLLPTLYTPDAAVVAMAAAILPVAATFQLFDGTQAVGCGILRGDGDTRPAAVFNFVGYYLLALPLAWWFGLRGEHGLPGIWWSLSAGLAVVALLLLAWIAVRGPARRAAAANG